MTIGQIVTFDDATTMEVASPPGTVFSVDVEKRVIRGRAVPYGVVGSTQGRRFQFSQGKVRPREEGFKVKLWGLHDKSLASGVVTEWNDSPEGLDVAFQVGKGPEGDRALQMADDGIWDGLSIGPSEGAKYQLRDGIHHAVDIPIHEISLTPAPVFGGARVASVVFDDQEGTTTMTDTTTEGVETTTEASPNPDFSLVSDAIKEGFAALTDSGSTRPVVPAGAPLQVDEPAPYRFDGVSGAHDFSTDLIAGLRDNDSEAYGRVINFMQEAFSPAFDVDTGNVTTLNPTRTRPDMYRDERRFRTPLYDALYKGAITDMTPFIFPKFDSAASLVAPHVEGVEPTPGSFAATNQTVTPSAVSGKVEITREVWDQGGNPQVSTLIWNKMTQHYFSAIEVAAYNLLNGLTLTGGREITITTGASDDDLVNAVEDVITDLNFVAGGNTFNYSATHANLYKKLAQAVDSTGRKLLPLLGPTNAAGQRTARNASLDVAGVEFDPVPSLGAASAANGNSYLVDTNEVHVWNSAPQRLEFQYRVAYVDLGIWGYVATAVSDLAGVRRLKYDPVV